MQKSLNMPSDGESAGVPRIKRDRLLCKLAGEMACIGHILSPALTDQQQVPVCQPRMARSTCWIRFQGTCQQGASGSKCLLIQAVYRWNGAQHQLISGRVYLRTQKGGLSLPDQHLRRNLRYSLGCDPFLQVQDIEQAAVEAPRPNQFARATHVEQPHLYADPICFRPKRPCHEKVQIKFLPRGCLTGFAVYGGDRGR